MTDSIIRVLGFGFIVGWALNSMYRQYRDDKMFRVIIEKIDAEEEAITKKIVEEVYNHLPICYVEKHGNKDYLLYNRDTDAFMYQGKSYEELAELCSAKYDTVLVKGKDKSMWFVDGKVKELTSD
jgi:hypothetical protein